MNDPVISSLTLGEGPLKGEEIPGPWTLAQFPEPPYGEWVFAKGNLRVPWHSVLFYKLEEVKK